jgi:hypothetical protein
MMQWFGPEPFAAMCAELPRVEIPVGVACSWCEEAITAVDRGGFYLSGAVQPTHAECFIRAVVGSVAHQQRRCSCHGGTGEDDPALSKRAAAIAAAAEWERA